MYDEIPFDQPWRDLWRPETLPLALERLEGMNDEELSQHLSRLSDVLDAFVEAAKAGELEE